MNSERSGIHQEILGSSKPAAVMPLRSALWSFRGVLLSVRLTRQGQIDCGPLPIFLPQLRQTTCRCRTQVGPQGTAHDNVDNVCC